MSTEHIQDSIRFALLSEMHALENLKQYSLFKEAIMKAYPNKLTIGISTTSDTEQDKIQRWQRDRDTEGGKYQ